MKSDQALRWLGITTWVIKPGASAQGDAAEPVVMVGRAPEFSGEAATTAVNPCATGMPAGVLPATRALLELINIPPDQPLVMAILRALPAAMDWQPQTAPEAEPALQFGEHHWSLLMLQTDGQARRDLWRRLNRLPPE